MGQFNNWFTQKLEVSRYPLPQEIRDKKPDYVINVSDEYIIANHNVCQELNIKYFWFPMSECNHNMGLNSIFGALQILFLAEHQNKSVILHCHAGSNRSVTVAQAFYYLKTGVHFNETYDDTDEESYFKMFNIIDDESKKSYRKMLKRNRIQNNIDAGHLPGIFNFESFLMEAKTYFKNYQIASGGSLDSIKIKSKTTNY